MSVQSQLSGIFPPDEDRVSSIQCMSKQPSCEKWLPKNGSNDFLIVLANNNPTLWIFMGSCLLKIMMNEEQSSD